MTTEGQRSPKRAATSSRRFGLRTEILVIFGCCVWGVGQTIAAATFAASMRVHVTVLARAVVSSNMPPTLTISAADVACGHVDRAAILTVKANSPVGFALHFSLDGSFLQAAEVRGLDAPAVVADAETVVVEPFRDVETMAPIAIRFDLSSTVSPGTYNWPLSVAASPLDGSLPPAALAISAAAP